MDSWEKMNSAISRSLGTKVHFILKTVDEIWTPIDLETSQENDVCCLCLEESEGARQLGRHSCSAFHLSHMKCLSLYAEFCHGGLKALKCPAGCGKHLKNKYNNR